MSVTLEGCSLHITELQALMSLGGSRTLFGISAPAAGQEDLWDACCRLLADGMITQIDGQYRPCQELFDVLHPMRSAQTVIVLTPAEQSYPQMIYYLSHRITMILPLVTGSLSLYTFEREELINQILECGFVHICPPQIKSDKTLQETVELDMDTQQLCHGADFTVEMFSAQTGTRLQWMRVIRRDGVPWLQTCRAQTLVQTVFTREQFGKRLLQMMQEEENDDFGGCTISGIESNH